MRSLRGLIYLQNWKFRSLRKKKEKKALTEVSLWPTEAAAVMGNVLRQLQVCTSCASFLAVGIGWAHLA